MFFESAALWNSTTGQLTFFLREGKVGLEFLILIVFFDFCHYIHYILHQLGCQVLDRQVTLSTEPGECLGGIA